MLTTVTRILFAMMLCHIMASLASDESISIIPGTRENTATCEAQGFILNFAAHGIMFWDMALSMTYVLISNSGGWNTIFTFSFGLPPWAWQLFRYPLTCTTQCLVLLLCRIGSTLLQNRLRSGRKRAVKKMKHDQCCELSSSLFP